MHTSDYLNQSVGDWPAMDVIPTASPWMDFATIRVRSGSVWIGDPHLLSSDTGLTVTLRDGNYSVVAKGMDFNGHRRISRMRVVPVTATRSKSPLRRSRAIGEVIVEEAVVAILDLETMERNFGPKEQPKLQRMLRRQLGGPAGQLNIKLDNASQFDFAYAVPGLGDGEYPVFAVGRSGQVVGVEIVFLGKECSGWEETIGAPRIGR